jgi:multidrug resistance efflux pump
MRRTWIPTLVVSLALAGCGAAGGNSESLPTVVLQGGSETTPVPQAAGRGSAAASGVVVPAQQADMAFVLGGNVKAVSVELGDEVNAGQVLVELENTGLEAQLEIARRAVRELTSPSAVAAAEQALANAEKALKDAEYNRTVQQQGYRASPETIRAAEAKLLLANEEVDHYQALYDRASSDEDKALALVNLHGAEQRRDTALRELNWYKGKPSENDQALLEAEVAMAQAARQEAEWYLAAVKGEAVPANASGPRLTLLQNARDQLAAADAAFENTRLKAPFAGTVATLKASVGDYLLPGVMAAVIVDMRSLHVETTDLSELDVTAVSVGQECAVSFDALGQSVTGHVSRISPLPTTLGGDVVYAVTVELAEIPEGLLAGMSAEVAFGD